MKKLSLALALLGLSSTAAYAGGIDYQEPEESGVFMVGVEALYARAGGADFLYGLTSVTDNNGNTVSRSLGVDSEFQWGYHIDLGYAMPGDGPDIELGYTNFSFNDHENRGGVIGNLFAGLNPAAASILGGVNGFVDGGVGQGLVNAKTEYDYVDVDLLLGKEFILQNRYHFHPFAGVRYASIESKDKASYYFNGEFVGSGSITNEFSGLGPRAGVDGAMEIANGFSLVARAAGSILIGDFDYKYQVSNPSGVANANNPESFVIRNTDEHFTVPETDYRLAINYTHEFSPETSFGLELGWQAVHYYDVMDKSSARFATTVGDNQDWGFQGPYLRVQANIA